MRTPVDREGYAAGDIRPDGGYVAAAVRDSFLSTHLGTLVCPDEPRWPRITTTGAVKIAYQGARRTPEWSASAGSWQFYGEACGAPGPVIYDRDGRLRISDCSGASEGYHSVAPGGRLVWGNEVTVRAGSELRESTDLGDGIYVGQGPSGGCWAQAPDGYREIGPGIAKCVRATRGVVNGVDTIAICWYEPDVPHVGSATARFRWMTVAELLARPAARTTKPAFVDEPPCEVPSFAPAEHAIAVHIFGGPGFRMNLGAGHDRDPNAKPSGAFVTIDHDGEDAFQRQAAYARQHGVPLFQYIDKGTPWRAERLRRVDGVRCVATVRCYPTAPDSVFHALTDIGVLRAAGIETALVMAGYRQMVGYGPQMNWRLPDVLAIASEVWAHAAKTPTVRHALIFHQRRQATHPETGEVHVDGLDSRTELQLMADRIIAAAAAYVPPKPQEPETPSDPAPVPVTPSDPETPENSPEPTPEPIPDPPMITRPPSDPVSGVSPWFEIGKWIAKQIRAIKRWRL